MPDYTQQSEGGGASPEASGEKSPLVRKVVMIDPGFRDPVDTSVLRPRILGIAKPQDPTDRRNLKFLGLAMLVAIVIFVALEYRQLRLAAHEAKMSAVGFFERK
jgi:hypothetical protein